MRLFSNGIERSLIVFAALALPSFANSQAVTYDFTGAITAGYGIYAGASGSTISGTYTIDLAAGNPSSSYGTYGSSSFWYVQNFGGPPYGTPSVNSLVFADSLTTSGGITYSVTTPGTAGSYSAVYGTGSSYQGANDAYSSSNAYIENDLLLGSGGDSNGLPTFSPSSNNIGYFYNVANGDVIGEFAYNIQSFSAAPTTMAAPEIDPSSAASGLTLLLGGVMVLRGRRSREPFRGAV